MPQLDNGNRLYVMSIAYLHGCLCVFAEVEDVGVDVWFMIQYGVEESRSKVFSDFEK